MSSCELCGREYSTLMHAKIEGAILDVCSSCAMKGKIVDIPGMSGIRNALATLPEREIKIAVDEVVSGFGKIIRDARAKKEWDVKKLAEVLHAKESLMHKIENEKIKPDMEFAHRIEHALHVHIIQKSDSGEDVKGASGAKDGMTLGDFVKVKKR